MAELPPNYDGKPVETGEKVLAGLRELLQNCTRVEIETTSAKGKLDGKDVLLLIGSTGSGKTLTIHFLLGQAIKPKLIKREGVKHGGKSVLMPVVDLPRVIDEVTKEQRIPLQVGTREGVSKTRGIEVVDLPALGMVAADTGGFADSEGWIRDMENLVALRSVLAACKTVLPLLIFNWAGMNVNRSEYVKDLVDLLGRLFVHETDWKASLVTFITRYDNTSKGEIYDRLSELSEEIARAQDTRSLALLQSITRDLDGQLEWEEKYCDRSEDTVAEVDTDCAPPSYPACPDPCTTPSIAARPREKVLLLTPTDSDLEHVIEVLKDVPKLTSPKDAMRIVLSQKAQGNFDRSKANMLKDMGSWMEGRFDLVTEAVTLLSQLQHFTGQFTGKWLEEVTTLVTASLGQKKTTAHETIERMIRTGVAEEKDCLEIRNYRNLIYAVEQALSVGGSSTAGLIPEGLSAFDEFLDTAVASWHRRTSENLKSLVDDADTKEIEKMLSFILTLGRGLEHEKTAAIASSLVDDTVGFITGAIIPATDIAKSVRRVAEESLAHDPDQSPLDNIHHSLELLEATSRYLYKVLVDKLGSDLVIKQYSDTLTHIAEDALKQCSPAAIETNGPTKTILSELAVIRTLAKHKGLLPYVKTSPAASELWTKTETLLLSLCDKKLEEMEKLLAQQLAPESMQMSLEFIKGFRTLSQTVSDKVAVRFSNVVTGISQLLQQHQSLRNVSLLDPSINFGDLAAQIKEAKSCLWIDEHCASQPIKAQIDRLSLKLREYAEDLANRSTSLWSKGLYQHSGKLMKKLQSMAPLAEEIEPVKVVLKCIEQTALDNVAQFCSATAANDSLYSCLADPSFRTVAQLSKICKAVRDFDEILATCTELPFLLDLSVQVQESRDRFMMDTQEVFRKFSSQLADIEVSWQDKAQLLEFLKQASSRDQLAGLVDIEDAKQRVWGCLNQLNRKIKRSADSKEASRYFDKLSTADCLLPLVDGLATLLEEASEHISKLNSDWQKHMDQSIQQLNMEAVQHLFARATKQQTEDTRIPLTQAVSSALRLLGSTIAGWPGALERQESNFGKLTETIVNLFPAIRGALEILRSQVSSQDGVEKFSTQLASYQKNLNVYIIRLAANAQENLLKPGKMDLAIQHRDYLESTKVSFQANNILEEATLQAMENLKKACEESNAQLLEKTLLPALQSKEWTTVNMVWQNCNATNNHLVKYHITKFFDESLHELVRNALDARDTREQFDLLQSSLKYLDGGIVEIVKGFFDLAEKKIQITQDSTSGQIQGAFMAGNFPQVLQKLEEYADKKEFLERVKREMQLHLDTTAHQWFQDLASSPNRVSQSHLWCWNAVLAMHPHLHVDSVIHNWERHVKTLESESATLSHSDFTTMSNVTCQQVECVLSKFFIEVCKLTPLSEISKETWSQHRKNVQTFLEKCLLGAVERYDAFKRAISHLDFHRIKELLRVEYCGDPIMQIFRKKPTEDFPELAKVREGLTSIPHLAALESALLDCISKQITSYNSLLASHDFKALEELVVKESDIQALAKEYPRFCIDFALTTKLQSHFQEQARLAKDAWYKTLLNELTQILLPLTKASSLLSRIHVDPIGEIREFVMKDISKQRATVSSAPVVDFAAHLCYLRELVDLVPQLETEFRKEITANLQAFIRAKDKEAQRELAQTLVAHQLIGRHLIDENVEFEFMKTALLNPKMAKQDINYVLKELRQQKAIAGSQEEPLDTTLLRELWDLFDMEYNKLLKDHCLDCDLTPLVNEVKRTRFSFGQLAQNLPRLLAKIFTVWSLQNASQSFREVDCLRRPHCAQVVSIFLLLLPDLLGKSGVPSNKFIRVLTGEGKSILLGVSAILLCMLGYSVDVVSYSKYLSERDNKAFDSLFTQFGMRDKIFYSTIEELCEKNINMRGSVRQRVTDFLNSPSTCKSMPDAVPTKRALLIDEVDVFFGEGFLGVGYRPAAFLQSEDAFNLINFVWQHYMDTGFTIATVQAQPCYTNLTAKYPTLKQLFDFQIHQMIANVGNYKTDPPYHLSTTLEKIGYKQSGLSMDYNFSMYYPHKTTCAYLHELENKAISLKAVKANIGLSLSCGVFSFAEFPKQYDLISGVTGTLALTNQELALMSEYNISNLYLAPSVFGAAQLDWNPENDQHILIIQSLDQQLLEIQKVAMEQQSKGRAVLVFFNTATSLDNFFSFVKRTGVSLELQVIKEETDNKETLIRAATVTKTITLLTRSFGRGIDFICFDQRVSDAGGVFVIQTFFSESVSEEIQMKGRTARQGNRGAYRQILWDQDLMSVFKFTSDEIESFRRKDTYKTLCARRTKRYEEIIAERLLKVEEAKAQHMVTGKFISDLFSFAGNPTQKAALDGQLLRLAEEFLNQLPVSQTNYLVVMCVDESGSMQHKPWADLLVAIDAFCKDRLDNCLKNGVKCGDQIAVVGYSHVANVRIPVRPLEYTLSKQMPAMDGGGTDFAAGLNKANEVFTSLEGPGKNFGNKKPVLVFMSDGDCGNGDQEMAALYNRHKPEVFVIHFGSNAAHAQRLKRLSENGRGKFSAGIDGAALKADFQKIASTLSAPVFKQERPEPEDSLKH